uniref:Pentacotripeptide-repeat region of PRORP domain-containing protein n=1 Tax=Davidia involucrata TaxID=16924 RepID=A0A5B7BX50_DAVIN
MWRSVVVARRSSLSKNAGRPLLKLLSVQNPPQQVPLYQTLILFQSSSPSHFSTWVVVSTKAKAASLYQNPRFFSHDSLKNHSPNDDVEQHIESPIPEIDEDHAFSDRDSAFDEIPCSVSSEFEEPASSSIFDETGDTLTRGDSVFDDNKSVEVETHEVDLEQLESVLSLLQSSGVGGSLESSLDSMGLTLHEEFVIRVLETPLVPGENLVGFFKWASMKPDEFSVTTRAVDALVRAICSDLKKKDAYALWDFIKEVGEKESGVLNTEILNELISLFSRLGKGKAGFEVFNKFGEFGCVPNAETYYFTIEALCRRSIFDWACSVCEKMLNAGDLPDGEKIGKIISYLCKGSKAKDAHMVYLWAKEKNRYPPQSSANFLISLLCREDETVHLALEMLEDFSGEERKYAIKPFSSVISGLSRIKDVEGAKKLLFSMIDAGPPPGNAVFNSIINSLSKAGDMEAAMKMMKLMENRGLRPDVYTYSVIMSGYAKGGEMDRACNVLAEAKKNHSKLTPVTYHTLIRGYCKLEEFDKALTLLGEMKEYGVQPNADEYNKLIQSLCLKTLNWATAEKLLEEMKENGLHLNGITKGLIRAVRELEEEEGKNEQVTVEAQVITS